MADSGRPSVLHCVADWGLPSERFVVDHVTSTRLTRPAVACGRRHDGPVPSVPVHAVLPRVRHVPARWRARSVRSVVAGWALRHRARLLHAHFGYWAAHTAAVAERLRLPWVVSLHGYDLLVMADREPELSRVRRADLVVVPSRFLAAAAVGRGFPEERVVVIPSGIDVDAYPFRERAAPSGRPVRVTFGGRFVVKKGVLDAARAMARARTVVPDLDCRFVGFGPLETELRDELARLRLPAEVVDGSTPGALVAALDATDLLLTASRTAPDGDAESLGLVNLEAQLAGVPVVSTRHGGIPEAVAADGAVLVPEGDVEGLGDALADLARHPQRWGAMGRAGHEHVRTRFRLDDRVRDVEEHYLELIARRRTS